MVVTHVAVALLLSVPVAFVTPEYSAAAVVGAVVGGAAPDLDLLVGTHRRTFHFPVLGWVVAVPAALVALLAPGAVTVGLAVATLGAAVHATSDVFGAGEELRPWERTNPNAVYDHLHGRWWRARYVIPYDGSVRDLALAVGASLPPLVVFDGPTRWGLLVALCLAAIYTRYRRDLVPYFEHVV